LLINYHQVHKSLYLFLGALTAHIKAPIHPKNVHPKNKFKIKIPPKYSVFRILEIIEGKRYKNITSRDKNIVPIIIIFKLIPNYFLTANNGFGNG